MSKKLEIGASLRRRQYAGEQQQEPGESAWDLPRARYAGSQSQADAEPANEQRQSADHPGNRHHDRQLSSTDWSLKTAEEPALDADEASDRLGLSPVSERRDAENKGRSNPSLDLMRLARGLWHRKWLVTLIILASVVLSFLMVQAMPHEWRATTTLMTSNSEAVPQEADARRPEPQHYMLQTFVDTIKLPTSLDETMRRAGISVMRSTLASAISIQLDNASTLLSISVTWDDPRMAARIASTVAELFLENSSEIRFRRIKERYNEYNAQLREAR
ncbi:Wzz/FepE/Etk N-terminal domain-containing protein [Halochromatium sp.]